MINLNPFFPDGIHVTGEVEEVIIAVNGNHQILVRGGFHYLSRIDLKI